MSLVCICPAAAEIQDITQPTCFEGIGQVQKFLLQRIYSSGSTRNGFTIASTDPDLLATWTTVLAASNGTKVVQSPFLDNPVSPPGEGRWYGGDNGTRGGIQRLVGRLPQSFSAEFLDMPQLTITQIKEYQCEVALGVYLITEAGNIVGHCNNIATPTIFRPIPVSGFYVSDKGLGGLTDPDKNMVSWNFYPNWSDLLHVIVPTNFDALNDLVSA